MCSRLICIMVVFLLTALLLTIELLHPVLLPQPQPIVAEAEINPAIQAMVDMVSPTLLLHHVCKLQDDDSLAYCNELGTRYSYATAKLNEAAQYLYSTYATLELQVTYDSFIYSSAPMTNVVAELPGLGPDRNHVYILCAHYDSISDDPPEDRPWRR